MKRTFLAAKFSLVVAVLSTLMITPVKAGVVPVIDGANLPQNIMTAMESVTQTLNQIEQYKTQLMQYENQLRNTMAPAAYIRDRAQSTINSLMDATDTLNYDKNQLGSLDSYISKFHDLNYYKGSPCFTADGCSESEREALKNVRQLASESQKKANDALFKGLKKQQDNLTADASTLQRIRSLAQDAKGQRQAIGYANQLAGQQANQLLQIRGLLIAQYNAAATKMQADADREAQTQAADEQFRHGETRASAGLTW